MAHAAAGGPRGRPQPVGVGNVWDNLDLRQPHTFQEEMDRREQQIRRDEELARLMEEAVIHDGDDWRLEADMVGWGNGGPNHINVNYVHNGTNAMGGMGDANMGRRGERESGRRQRPRNGDQNGWEPGLPPDFLGNGSVFGGGDPHRW